MAYYARIEDVIAVSAGRVQVNWAVLHTTNLEFRDDRQTTFMCPVGVSAGEVAKMAGDAVLAEAKPIVDSMNTIAQFGTQVRNMLLNKTYPATPV